MPQSVSRPKREGYQRPKPPTLLRRFQAGGIRASKAVAATNPPPVTCRPLNHALLNDRSLQLGVRHHRARLAQPACNGGWPRAPLPGGSTPPSTPPTKPTRPVSGTVDPPPSIARTALTAVREYLAPTGPGSIDVTTDAGRTWQTRYNGPPPTLVGARLKGPFEMPVTFRDPHHGFGGEGLSTEAFPFPHPPSADFFNTSDGGVAWAARRRHCHEPQLLAQRRILAIRRTLRRRASMGFPHSPQETTDSSPLTSSLGGRRRSASTSASTAAGLGRCDHRDQSL